MERKRAGGRERLTSFFSVLQFFAISLVQSLVAQKIVSVVPADEKANTAARCEFNETAVSGVTVPDRLESSLCPFPSCVCFSLPLPLPSPSLSPSPFPLPAFYISSPVTPSDRCCFLLELRSSLLRKLIVFLPRTVSFFECAVVLRRDSI